PVMKMAGLEGVVSDEGKVNRVDQDRGRDKTIAEPGAGEAFRAAVIFGHGLESNAPPKVAIDLDVPLIPAGVGGITPVFLVEQIEHRTEEVMTVLPVLAPVTEGAQSAGKLGAGRQMFVRADDGTRRPFAKEPGKVTRPDARQGQSECEQRDNIASGYR